jgi:CheY-like chemotaxis protein
MKRGEKFDEKIILLVEDNPNDVLLTRRAFKQARIHNKLLAVKDGAEALDYLFGSGSWAGRDLSDMPLVVLLDIKLPKINGLEVLKMIRADKRIKLLPVVILTLSKEEKDIIDGYALGANSYICKPVDFNQFAEAVRQLGLYWIVLNEKPPINNIGSIEKK